MIRTHRRRAATCAILIPVLALPALALPAAAATDPASSAGHGDPSALVDPSAIEPHEASYGLYVDTYRQNTTEYATPDSNPAIGVLSEMLGYFTPGSTWNDGTVRNEALHEQNIRAVEEITQNRTRAEADNAYLSDTRDQNYTMSSGLDEDTAAFRDLANVGTTIPDEVPEDARTTEFDDEGNANGVWADEDSALGSVVQLVNTVRGEWATSNRAKDFYQYMRPFRWSDDVVVVPELEPAKKPESEAETDAGFPSGHTNAAFLAGIALANAVPEHSDDLILKAAEVGHSRVVAGMHSPLDVIGGRVLATAIAGATLADAEHTDLIDRAAADAEDLLDAQLDLDTDREAYQERLAAYIADTTFGLDSVGEAGAAPRVPAAAEELIRTRYPSLDDEQLRWILYSTALDSGLPVIDDAEGWGRVNLFAASNGYGAFDRDVTMTLDGDATGYAAQDVWRNDIDGAGGLTLGGSGELTLAGENSFAGGVRIVGGTLAATTTSALGSGDVALTDGTLADRVDASLAIGGSFAQSDGAELALAMSDASAPALSVAGSATLAGQLDLDLSALDAVPESLPILAADAVTGEFENVEFTGLPNGYEAQLVVEDGVLTLVDGSAAPAPEPTADPTPAPEPSEDPGDGDDLAPTGGDTSLFAALAAALLIGFGGLTLAVRRRLRQ